MNNTVFVFLHHLYGEVYGPQLWQKRNDQAVTIWQYRTAIEVFIHTNKIFRKYLFSMLQNIPAKSPFIQIFVAYSTSITSYKYVCLLWILYIQGYVLAHTELYAALCMLRYVALSYLGLKGHLVSCIIFKCRCNIY